MMTDNGDLDQKLRSLEAKNRELKARLEETEEALRAISTGEVDALVVYGDQGERIYTLQGADYAYRVMVESIHEGAATIRADGTVLYGNKRLAEMLETPLELMLGSSFYNYLLPAESKIFSALAEKGLEDFGKVELSLMGKRGTLIPVLVTASAAEVDGRRGVCLVVTDLTEQKRAMARERELQAHLMKQREEERVRIARNLHDGPLQDLLGLSYTMHGTIMALENTPEGENLTAMRESLLKLAGELRNVCNDLRPPSTIRFGLARAIQSHCEDIQAKYPELAFDLELVEDRQAIPKNVSTALFRIFQESLNNIIRHASAQSASIRLELKKNLVLMEVQDDGDGFELPDDWVGLARQGHLGLVGMRERAEAVGGRINIVSSPCKGTTIQVEVPCELGER